MFTCVCSTVLSCTASFSQFFSQFFLTRSTFSSNVLLFCFVFLSHQSPSDTGGRSAGTTLVITVNDVNESPLFPNEAYTFTIGEHTQIGPIVEPVKAIVLATDPDKGQNLKHTILSVEPSSASTVFAIDSCSGQIVLAEPNLNFEERTLYTLTIQAMDDGAIPFGLISSTIV